MIKLKKIWVAGLLALALVAGCSGISPYTYQGAGIGGALGAGAGALIDSHNRWRGAMIGGLMGGALGGAATEMGRRAAQDQQYQSGYYGPRSPQSYQSQSDYDRGYYQ